MKKYTYSYETVTCELSGWGALGGNVYETGPYRAVIDRKSSQGWRYAGFVPVKQRGTGHLSQIDLVFEKEEQ